MSEVKKFFPEGLIDLKPFKKICPARKIVPLTTFNLDMFIKRHNAIIHVDENNPYPANVEFVGAPEFCGEEDNCKLYKIFVGNAKVTMIVAVDSDDLISKIAVYPNVNDKDAAEIFGGILVLILRNADLDAPEIQAVNKMIQNDEDLIFHWCPATKRFIFLNFIERDNIIYAGFFAAVEQDKQ